MSAKILKPRNDDRVVRLSKSLAYVLRHGAEKEGLPIRADGYIPVAAVLSLKSFRGFTITDVEECVRSNDKQRYRMMEEGAVKYIRANQGHSVQVEQLELSEIADPSEIPCVVHGTDAKHWESIAKTGLSKMSRNHIHFAAGRLGDPGVTSGMRKNCTLFIKIDVPKAMADGIKFYRSANNVILSAGINGVISKEYFSAIEDEKGRPFAH